MPLILSVPDFVLSQPIPRQGPEVSAPELIAASTLDRPDPSQSFEFDRAFSEPFTIRDGLKKNYQLATDEVFQPTTDGVGQLVRVTGAKTPSALAQVVNILNAEYRLETRLVVYAVGNPRTSHHRKTLSRDVTVVTADPAAALEAAQKAGLRLKNQPGFSKNHLVLTSDSSVLSLMGSQKLREAGFAAEPLLYRRATPLFLPNDPYFPLQWHISGRGQNGAKKASDAKVPGAWDLRDSSGNLIRGSGIVIGIVDDGVQVGGITDTTGGCSAYSLTEGTDPHPDLQFNMSTSRYNWNPPHIMPLSFPEYDPNPNISDNHGTSVAGVAAAVGYNSIGGTGVAPAAQIAPLRLIADDFTDADEAESYDFGSGAKGEGRVHIKNNSWGIGNHSTDLTTFGDGSDPITETPPSSLAAAALQNAVTQQGQIILFAAGNGQQQGENTNYRGRQNSIYVIPVAAVNDQAVQCNYSTPGSSIVISAPSGGESGTDARPQGTLTTDRTGADGYNPPPVGSDLDNISYTEHFNGTSSACPVVAGVTALVLQANPNLNWRDMKEIFIRSAARNDPGDPGWDRNGAGFWFNHKYGAGLVNATQAVRLARSALQNPSAIGTYGKSMTTISTSLEGLKTDANDQGALIPDNIARGYVRRFDTRQLAGLRVEHATVTVDIDHPDRGELEIQLTSPEGTVSRLAETHISGFLNPATGLFDSTPRDENANYPDWTFSTVHNWGEDSRGLWTLRVADRKKGNLGLLNSATLTLYGTAK